jgi:hypothetical protein
MELIKENLQKKRQVWKYTGGYKKIWLFSDPVWLEQHIELVNICCPNYITDFGFNNFLMWITMKELPGKPASTFEHTEDFIKKIYTFCLNNIKETKPYFHGDWVLSNMIIDENQTIRLCDWDNLNLYSQEDVLKKLHKDLKSAFGSKFTEIIEK